MSARFGLRWSRWLATDRPLDPYLIWADRTDFSAFGLATGDALPLLLELAPGALTVAGLPAPLDTVDVPPAQRQAVAHRGTPGFVTARVPARSLPALLDAAPLVPRFQLGLARSALLPPHHEDRPVQPPRPLRTSAPAPAAPPGSNTVVAIIDDGCPFAHPNLADAGGGTRVRHLWDQGAAAWPGAPRPWAGAGAFGGGLEIDGTALSRYVAAFPGRAVYPALGVDRITGRSFTHGNGTCHVAAGKDVPIDLNRGRVGPDGASALPVIFVQLPLATVADTSGGSIGYHVLNALHYIEQRARGLSADGTPPQVVTNLGYGSVAGPHDGTSLPERAVVDFLQTHTNLSLVVPAGNSVRGPLHERFDLGPRQTHTVGWQIRPDHGLESYLEIWWPEGAPLDQLEVRLAPPGSATIGARAGGTAFEAGPDPRHGIVFCRRVAQGLNGTMALLAVRATRGAHAAPPGRWQVQIVNHGATAVAGVNLWVERNDVVIGRRRRQQACLDTPTGPATPRQRRPMELASLSNVDPVQAFGSPYTVRHLVVGATELCDGQPWPRSCAGPARAGARTGPDGMAPGALGPARGPLHVDGPFPGTRSRTGGTSAATAVVTRQLAGDFFLSRQAAPPAPKARSRSNTPRPAPAPVPQPLVVVIPAPPAKTTPPAGSDDGWFRIRPA